MNNNDIASVTQISERNYRVEVWTPDGNPILVRFTSTRTDAEILKDALVEAIRGWAPVIAQADALYDRHFPGAQS